MCRYALFASRKNQCNKIISDFNGIVNLVELIKHIFMCEGKPGMDRRIGRGA